MAAPAAYLRRIMLNEQMSHRRQMRRRLVMVSSTDAANAPVASQADAADRRDEVWRWLATLKPQQRAVLVLRCYKDLPDVEIADLLGGSEATVRSHAFRGLAALRSQLRSPHPGGDS